MYYPTGAMGLFGADKTDKSRSVSVNQKTNSRRAALNNAVIPTLHLFLWVLSETT
jgi:hypothetical protein